MKKFLMWCLLLIPALVFVSCDKDDDIHPTTAVEAKFKEMYPQATNISWGSTTNHFYVAYFRNNGIKTEAWYSSNGTWAQTESLFKYSDLSQAIKDNLAASKYSDWVVDDVTKLERPDIEDTYIIEVEKYNAEALLYYTTDGVLIRESFSNEWDNLPVMMPQPIRQYVADRYPFALIIELAIDESGYNVYLLNDRSIIRMVFSNPEYEWLETYQLVYKVPTIVMDAFRAQTGENEEYTQVNYVTTATGEAYYAFTVANGTSISVIKIDPEGNVIQ